MGCGPVGLVHFLPEAAARVRLDPLLVKYGGCLPLAEPQLSLAAAGEDLPLASASVDVCICFNAFDHMRNPQAALAEIHRVLRPRGTLLVDCRRVTLSMERASIQYALSKRTVRVEPTATR